MKYIFSKKTLSPNQKQFYYRCHNATGEGHFGSLMPPVSSLIKLCFPRCSGISPFVDGWWYMLGVTRPQYTGKSDVTGNQL